MDFSPPESLCSCTDCAIINCHFHFHIAIFIILSVQSISKSQNREFWNSKIDESPDATFRISDWSQKVAKQGGFHKISLQTSVHYHLSLTNCQAWWKILGERMKQYLDLRVILPEFGDYAKNLIGAENNFCLRLCIILTAKNGKIIVHASHPSFM